MGIGYMEVIRAKLTESSTPTHLIVNDKYWQWEPSETGDVSLAIVNAGKPDEYIIGGAPSRELANAAMLAWAKREGFDFSKGTLMSEGAPASGKPWTENEMAQIQSAVRDGDMESVKHLVQTKKQGRNEPCACGSGKKYKRCCGKVN